MLWCIVIMNVWLATAMDRYKDRTKWCLLIAALNGMFGIVLAKMGILK